MGTISYEGIIVSAIGEFGLSQLIITLTVKLSTAVVAWAMVMTSLIGAEPEWWKHTAIVNSSSNFTSVNRVQKVCLDASVNESGRIVFDDTIHTIVVEWNLICDKEWIPRTIMTTQMVGVMVGASVIGQIADWFGRKKCIVGAYILVLVSVLVQGFANSWYTMAVLAFFLGLGLGGFLVCCNVFYLEYVGTKWRTLIMTIPAWPLGVMLLGGVFKFIPNWRYLCYANFVFGCPALVLYWFCPESIRWLLTHGRAREAKQILDVLARRNKRPSPDFAAINEVVQEDVTTSERDQIAKYNYFTLFTIKFARWRILVFGFIWFSMAFGYYAITFGVGTLHGDISTNIVLQGLVELFGCFLVLLVSKFSGRRWSTFLLIMLTALSLFGITITYSAAEQRTFNIAKIVLALLAKFFIAASWTNVILLTAETFPTVIRNTAYGLCNVFARIGGILAPQNKALHNVSPHLPFTFNGVVQFISAILCLFLSDTYAAHLPDNFEDEEQHGGMELEVPVATLKPFNDNDTNKLL